MGLTVYSLEESEKWDAVVRSFQEYDVYYLSGYVKAFQIHGDGDPLLFYYDDQTVRGINVVMKRDVANDTRFQGRLPKEKYYDFATPYGYGGWLMEGPGEKSGLFYAYEQWCRNHGIISEFVRFHPVLGNQKWSDGPYEVIRLGKTVAMNLTSPEAIWANITSKNRNAIRKAQKNNINIYKSQNIDIYRSFQEIYNKTMDKDNAAEYYYFPEAFYDSILRDLSNNAQVFYAQIPDGTIIAASIMLWANGRMNYHLSGSVKEYQNLAPCNLLLYEAALWGYQNGMKTLHMGGGVGSKEDSLYKFKKAFNRSDDYIFCIGKKVWNQEIYEQLCGGCKRGGFFPEYRG